MKSRGFFGTGSRALRYASSCRVLSVCIALAVSAAALSLTPASDNQLSGGIVGVVVVAVMHQALRLYGRGQCSDSRALAVLSLLLAIATVFGNNLLVEDTLAATQPVSWLKIATLFIGLYACAAVLLPTLATTVSGLTTDGSHVHLIARLEEWLRCHEDRRRDIFFLTILAVWCIWWLGAFPGIYGYDAIFQVDQYASGVLTEHHPLLHTLALGWSVVDLGGMLGVGAGESGQ